MKKVISMLLVLVMCLSMFCTFTVSAAMAKLPNFYYENLVDGAELGSQGGFSSASIGKNTVEVVDDPGNGDRSVLLSAGPRKTYDSSDQMGVTYQAPGSQGHSGDLVMETKVKLADWDALYGIMCYNYARNKSGYLFQVQKNGTIQVLGVNTGISILTGAHTPKYTTISLVYSTRTGQTDLYIDYLHRASLKHAEPFSDLWIFRVNIQGIPANSKSKLWLSEFRVYEGTKPLKPDERAKTEWSSGMDAASGATTLPADMSLNLLKNKTAFYPNAYYGVAGGKQITLANNQKAYMENGYTMIPLSVAAKGLNGNADTLAGNSQKVTIMGKEAVFTGGSATVKVDGEDVEMPVAAKLNSGELMVPADILATISGWHLFNDKEFGLAILSEGELYYDWTIDLPNLNGIINLLCYERQPGKQMIADAKAYRAKGEHPRLLFTKEDFDRARKEIETSELKQKWYKDAEKAMGNILNKPVMDYENNSDGAHTGHGTFWFDNNTRMAAWYQLTGDKRYAERVWENMQVLCGYDKWYAGTSWNSLGWSRTLMGYSVALDLIYDYLTPDQRAIAFNGLLNGGLIAGDSNWNDYKKVTQADNWKSAFGIGGVLASLVGYDESEAYEKVAIKVLDKAMRQFEAACSSNSPDGSYWEGTGYYISQQSQWPFGIAGLLNACGKDYGLLNSPGHLKLYYWPYTLAGYEYWGYNHASANPVTKIAQEYQFFAAKLFKDENLKGLYYKNMLEDGIKGSIYALLWCEGDPDPSKAAGIALDNYTRVEEIMTFRDRHGRTNSFFAGLHGGFSRAMQMHLDAGNFIVQSNGDHFFIEHDTLDYNTPNFGHGMYRYKAEGHNTLHINPPKEGEEKEQYDQELYEMAPVERFETNEVSALGIVNLTAPYGERAKSVRRGMKFTNGRTTMILQDEVVMDPGSEIFWSGHLEKGAKVTLSDDKKTAVVDVRGNKLEVKILSEQGKFEIEELKHRPGTMQNSAELPYIAGYEKLTIHESNVSTFNVTVAFTPLKYAPKGGIKYPAIVPLDEWTLDDPETISVPDIPYLNDLKIDGKSIPNFMNEVTYYEYGMKSQNQPMPTITATADAGLKVEVNYPESIPGTISIDVSNDFYTNNYRITYTEALPSLADEGYIEIPLEAIEGSAETADSPVSNTLDNNFDTYCGQALPAYSVYDMGESYTFDTLSLSFYGGAARKLYFNVYVSDDGANWRRVGTETFISSGATTNQFENFDLGTQKAQYIKVEGVSLWRNGEDEMATTDLWFSIQEMKLFRKP